MTIQDQLYTIWFPLGIIVLFTLAGVLRGAVREGVVSAALALAALINLQWAGQWSQVTHDFYTGLSQGQQEFIISFSILWLVLIVVGYGLGTFMPRGPLTTSFRLGGGLLGLLNGAAAAGWTIRYAFISLQGAQTSSQFYQNGFSYSLMVWAVWFPLFLALLGAVLVLVGPLRRAQTAVSTPSGQTDWVPYSPQSQSSMAPTAAMPVMPQSDVAAPASGGVTTAAYQTTPVQTMAFPAQDAAPATSLPVREAGSVSQEAQGEQDQAGTYSSPESAGSKSSWLLDSVSQDTAKVAAGNETGAVAPAGEATDMTAQTQSTPESCPNCGTPAAPGALFCTECGTKLTPR